MADPRIGGTARLVRGDYTFAGTRFDLTRGRILFDAGEPINPRLDILAETARSGTTVDIAITGNAQSPAIAFSSDPALPEEEILARLLFGGSVTSLSATDAVQLAAALAALQGGGGARSHRHAAPLDRARPAAHRQRRPADRAADGDRDRQEHHPADLCRTGDRRARLQRHPDRIPHHQLAGAAGYGVDHRARFGAGAGEQGL